MVMGTDAEAAVSGSVITTLLPLVNITPSGMFNVICIALQI
jgi:hypothetical protein